MKLLSSYKSGLTSQDKSRFTLMAVILALGVISILGFSSKTATSDLLGAFAVGALIFGMYFICSLGAMSNRLSTESRLFFLCMMVIVLLGGIKLVGSNLNAPITVPLTLLSILSSIFTFLAKK